MIVTLGIRPGTGKTETLYFMNTGFPHCIDALVKGPSRKVYLTEELDRLKIDFYVNDEGASLNLDISAMITRDGNILARSYGTVVFVSHDKDDNIISLNNEQMRYIDNYVRFFKFNSELTGRSEKVAILTV